MKTSFITLLLLAACATPPRLPMSGDSIIVERGDYEGCAGTVDYVAKNEFDEIYVVTGTLLCDRRVILKSRIISVTDVKIIGSARE